MSSDISSMSGAGGGGVAPSAPVLQIKARNLVRPPTPDTIFTERPDDTDMRIFCEKCQEPVSVRSTQQHRAFHNALSLLGYGGRQRPESVKLLLKKRQALVRDLNKTSSASNPVPFDRVQRINEAYELVKAHLEDTYEGLIETKTSSTHQCSGISLNCSAPCVRAVGICSDDNGRWKSKMEDTRVFQDYFGNDVNKCFFAIYDGYNGRFTADIAANDLHHILLGELQKVDEGVSCTCTVNLADRNDLSEYKLDRKTPVVRKDSLRHILHEESVNIIQQIMHTCQSNLVRLQDCSGDEEDLGKAVRKKKRCDPESENMAQAYHRTFRFLDRYLSYGINETSQVRWSGCSALCLLIQNSTTMEKQDKDRVKVDREDAVNGEEASKEKTDGEKEGQGEADGDRCTDKEIPPLEELGVIHLANTGNTHAVLCRAGTAYRLSKDHTPSNTQERSRVQKAGCSIQAGGVTGRVNGILDTTRGLGNYGDPHLKKALIADPHTTSVKIDQHAQFVVMATNGLWEVLTDEEVVSLVKQTLLIWQARTVTALVPEGLGHDFREATTFGEDFGTSMADGLAASFGQMGFDNTQASVLDSDGAEEVNGTEQRYHFKNPPNPRLPDVDSEEGDSGKSLITWNEPLLNGDQDENSMQNNSKEESNDNDEVRLKGDEGRAADIDVLSLRNYKEEFNDNASVKTDFESMLSAMCDDGNEADIETLTDLHTFYTKSRLSEGLSLVDEREEYRIMAQTISERLVKSALLAGSRDNLTVMVILLEGCPL